MLDAYQSKSNLLCSKKNKTKLTRMHYMCYYREMTSRGAVMQTGKPRLDATNVPSDQNHGSGGRSLTRWTRAPWTIVSGLYLSLRGTFKPNRRSASSNSRQ